MQIVLWIKEKPKSFCVLRPVVIALSRTDILANNRQAIIVAWEGEVPAWIVKINKYDELVKSNRMLKAMLWKLFELNSYRTWLREQLLNGLEGPNITVREIGKR